MSRQACVLSSGLLIADVGRRFCLFQLPLGMVLCDDLPHKNLSYSLVAQIEKHCAPGSMQPSEAAPHDVMEHRTSLKC